MENNTKEKALVNIKDNFFTKIRRFFMQTFSKKYDKFECAEENVICANIEVEKEVFRQNEEICDKNVNVNEIDENNVVEVYEDKEEIERKLMNYYESIKKCI